MNDKIVKDLLIRFIDNKMETSNSSSANSGSKITEEICFEILYFSKLVSLINVINKSLYL